MFELENPRNLDSTKTDLIKRHLNMVFKHEIDPSMGNAGHQEELSLIHNPPRRDEDDGDFVVRC